jgi:hypothetical protein
MEENIRSCQTDLEMSCFSSFAVYGFASFIFMDAKLGILHSGVIGERSKSFSHPGKLWLFLLC